MLWTKRKSNWIKLCAHMISIRNILNIDFSMSMKKDCMRTYLSSWNMRQASTTWRTEFMGALFASTAWADSTNICKPCRSSNNLNGLSSTNCISGIQANSWLCTINISAARINKTKNKTNTMRKCSMSSFQSFFAEILMNPSSKLF